MPDRAPVLGGPVPRGPVVRGTALRGTRPRNRRELILAAAADLFAEHG
jgi:hypothetical protein